MNSTQLGFGLISTGTPIMIFSFIIFMIVSNVEKLKIYESIPVYVFLFGAALIAAGTMIMLSIEDEKKQGVKHD